MTTVMIKTELAILLAFASAIAGFLAALALVKNKVAIFGKQLARVSGNHNDLTQISIWIGTHALPADDDRMRLLVAATIEDALLSVSERNSTQPEQH